MFKREFILGQKARIFEKYRECENCDSEFSHNNACLRRYRRLVNKPYSKPRLPKGARPIIESAIEAILAHPDTADMRTWLEHSHEEATRPEVEDGYCGTTACLAGHIGLAAGLPPRDNVYVSEAKRNPVLQTLQIIKDNDNNWWHKSSVHVSEIARELLALKDGEEDRVFLYDHWPQPFRRRYAQARSGIGRAQAMADRLQHYLDTGN